MAQTTFFGTIFKMAIIYKSTEEIATMRKSCRLAAEVLDFIEPYVEPGISTIALNDLCHKFIVDHGAYPSPLNYKGFPKSICTSVNSEISHGIPDATILREGDIVNLDITTLLEQYHGDTSKTFVVGKTSRAARDLVAAAEEALWVGIRAVRRGGHIGDIGEAVQKYVEAKGYTVVKEYGGHGIGKIFHEDPHVPHFGRRGTGPEIKTGMIFTIEPMVNLGKADLVMWDDDWTVETRDKKLSAQFEHTVAIFDDHLEVLTLSQKASQNPILPFST